MPDDDRADDSTEGTRPGPAARNRLNLIELITADAVVSDYTDAVADPSPSSRRQRVVVAAIALGVAGFVLSLGVSSRVLNAPAVDNQRDALSERITQSEARRGDLTRDLAELRAEVEQARAEELQTTQGGAALAVQIRRYEVATGYTPVEGPGVVVTLTDAPPDQTADDSEDLGAVIDSDVQHVVNGLWQAGAEAVAINGQRLTARSAIRSAAGAILVNYRPLRPPYRIQAIGDPETLESEFLAGPDAAELTGVSEQFGIGFTTESVDALRLPAATTALRETAQVITPGQGDTE